MACLLYLRDDISKSFIHSSAEALFALSPVTLACLSHASLVLSLSLLTWWVSSSKYDPSHSTSTLFTSTNELFTSSTASATMSGGIIEPREFTNGIRCASCLDDWSARRRPRI